MAGFEHLLDSFSVGDMLDDIASADPPAYLRRCFAEGCSAPSLSWTRVQQLALCAMVLDAIVNHRDYAGLEPELIADWRLHYAQACGQMQALAMELLLTKTHNGRCEERVLALEDALEAHGIPHRKWHPGDGSAPHSPLKPEAKP